MRLLTTGFVVAFFVGALTACSAVAPAPTSDTTAFGPVYSPMLQDDGWGDPDPLPPPAETTVDPADIDTAPPPTEVAEDNPIPDAPAAPAPLRPPVSDMRPDADIRTSIQGIPGLYWYRTGKDGFIVVPWIGSYHSDDFTLGLLGIANFNWRDTEWVDEETGHIGISVHDWNLLGLYRSNEYFFLDEEGRAMRETHRYLLWFIPISGGTPQYVEAEAE